MYIIQILLPVYDNKGKEFPSSYYMRIRQELTKKFKGLTAYTRAPAEGLWKDSKNIVQKDDIIIFEIMLPQIDKKWWGIYKAILAEFFSQDEIIIRVHNIDLL